MLILIVFVLSHRIQIVACTRKNSIIVYLMQMIFLSTRIQTIEYRVWKIMYAYPTILFRSAILLVHLAELQLLSIYK